MSRLIYGLLLFAPVALGAQLLSLPAWVVFALSAISLAPLAWLIGKATEALAQHLGPRFGGLLNATFGNAAELIITGLAVYRGLLTLVKASITGSIIGNTLLILGLSLFVGGIKHGPQRFGPRRASLNAAMMILAIAGLYLPAIFSLTVDEPTVIEEVSLFVAGALLVTYCAYLGYTVFQDRGKSRSSAEGEAADSAGENEAGQDKADAGEQRDKRQQGEQAEGQEGQADSSEGGAWGIGKSLAILGGAMVGTGVSSELLVRAVEPVTQQLGWSEFFVGVIVIPIAGNAAEHYSAVHMAWRNRLSVTLSITAGSSTQIALLVAPLLVFLSLLLGHPLNLIFTPLELAVLGLATLIFAYISLDGQSNWLEGVQLLALYLLAGLVFFFLPMHGG